MDTWRFNLRQGVKFHNGKEMTAEEKIETTDKKGKKSWEWKRTGRNELWDRTVYNAAARDIAARSSLTRLYTYSIQCSNADRTIRY